tara:strand:- start:329 stop:691 length:363 start_codon:yes stop_codon:yes gene_type:complete
MSTRAEVRFATREAGQSFSKVPSAIHARFYVHHDGYPEWLGIEIAESLRDSRKIINWEIDNLDTRRSDTEYIYYIWQKPQEEAYISIFTRKDWDKEDEGLECIFVGNSSDLIMKYSQNKY